VLILEVRMVESVTAVYLGLMFISLYMLSFFIILTSRNRVKLYYWPKPRKKYKVSVIIAAWNEQDSIKQTVENIFLSKYPKPFLEVIVVNDGSIDKTKEVVKKLLKKYPRLRLLDKKHSGKADSINQALKIAKGELIAVTDADSFPSKDSLRKLTGFFNDPKMGAVTSFVTVRNKEQKVYGKIQALEYMILAWNRKILDFVNSVYVTNGPLSVYKKKYLLDVGGFDKTSITEDIDITWNLMSHGYKTAMCFDARVSTIVPTKFKRWFRQRVRWGIGGIQVLFKYKQDFFKKSMFGYFVMPFVSLSIILSVFGFAYSAYLLAKAILTRLVTVGYSVAAETTIFSVSTINLYPSVMIFYFIVLFLSSVLYYNYILRTTKFYAKLNIKKFFKLSFYMLVFLAFYPIIWFAAIYRYVRKDFAW
jgi:cellulose synthase/poly-beta-1,6-N-acetylglucosamine synthase-like glycosyltransferase